MHQCYPTITRNQLGCILKHIIVNNLDSCDDGNDNTLTYFDSFGYLQTIIFTIGYGHITPTCNAGKVKFGSIFISIL